MCGTKSRGLVVLVGVEQVEGRVGKGLVYLGLGLGLGVNEIK